MIRTLGRRDFLVGSAAVAGAVGGGFTCVEFRLGCADRGAGGRRVID
jgi:hypothetical protein